MSCNKKRASIIVVIEVSFYWKKNDLIRCYPKLAMIFNVSLLFSFALTAIYIFSLTPNNFQSIYHKEQSVDEYIMCICQHTFFLYEVHYGECGIVRYLFLLFLEFGWAYKFEEYPILVRMIMQTNISSSSWYRVFTLF